MTPRDHRSGLVQTGNPTVVADGSGFAGRRVRVERGLDVRRICGTTWPPSAGVTAVREGAQGSTTGQQRRGRRFRRRPHRPPVRVTDHRRSSLGSATEVAAGVFAGQPLIPDNGRPGRHCRRMELLLAYLAVVGGLAGDLVIPRSRVQTAVVPAPIRRRLDAALVVQLRVIRPRPPAVAPRTRAPPAGR